MPPSPHLPLRRRHPSICWRAGGASERGKNHILPLLSRQPPAPAGPAEARQRCCWCSCCCCAGHPAVEDTLLRPPHRGGSQPCCDRSRLAAPSCMSSGSGAGNARLKPEGGRRGRKAIALCCSRAVLAPRRGGAGILSSVPAALWVSGHPGVEALGHAAAQSRLPPAPSRHARVFPPHPCSLLPCLPSPSLSLVLSETASVRPSAPPPRGRPHRALRGGGSHRLRNASHVRQRACLCGATPHAQPTTGGVRARAAVRRAARSWLGESHTLAPARGPRRQEYLYCTPRPSPETRGAGARTGGKLRFSK